MAFEYRKGNRRKCLWSSDVRFKCFINENKTDQIGVGAPMWPLYDSCSIHLYIYCNLRDGALTLFHIPTYDENYSLSLQLVLNATLAE